MTQVKAISLKWIVFPILVMLFKGATAQQNQPKVCTAGEGNTTRLKIADQGPTSIWILDNENVFNLTVHLTDQIPFATKVNKPTWFRISIERDWSSTTNRCKVTIAGTPTTIDCKISSVTLASDRPFIWTNCTQHPTNPICHASLYHVKNAKKYPQFDREVMATAPNATTPSLQLWLLPGGAENTEIRIRDRNATFYGVAYPNSATAVNVTGNIWQSAVLTYDVALMKMKFGVTNVNTFGHAYTTDVIISSLPDSYWLACSTNELHEYLLVPSRRSLIIATIILGLLIQIFLLIIAYHSFINEKSSRKYLKEKIQKSIRVFGSSDRKDATVSESTVPRSNQLQVPSQNTPISQGHGQQTSHTDQPLYSNMDETSPMEQPLYSNVDDTFPQSYGGNQKTVDTPVIPPRVPLKH